ncbi:hypothetical protein [Flavobacterium sp.]|jgi:hypothetical protein|uniref:hypothetical protein n=1 Tax=Flavobacterium sp. TaxID=239 RepID=UPI0037C1A903
MMEELDLLKKDWKKNENSFEQVSEVDIYKMLHKKSSSIVKWIFYISLLELLFGVVLNIVLSFTKYDEQNIAMFKKWGIYNFYIVLSVALYMVVFYFIYKFYQNYKKICVIDNTKHLLTTILNTRKVVKHYVIFNLTSFAVIFVTIFSVGFYHIYIDTMLKKGIEHPEISFKVVAISLLIIIIITSVFTFLFWLFYKVLYGILLKRLFRNYNELKKIDL